MSTRTNQFIERLCESSVNAIDNRAGIDWPETISGNEWLMSPQLLSLYGTSIWEELHPTEQRRLSLYEAINFFSLNIHGEKALVEGISKRLYQKQNAELTPYLHHFLDEENKHMMCFGRFCKQYGGKIYESRKVSFTRDYENGEEDFLFFARVVIFEEIVDVYNRRMALDASLNKTARALNRMHHDDEVRHLAFGRQVVLQLFEKHSHTWSSEALLAVQSYLKAYITGVWKEFYNPSVYKDVGIEEPYEVAAIAWASPSTSQHRMRCSQKLVTFLLKNRIINEAPEL